MIDVVIARLKADVAEFGGRVSGALELGALIASGSVPPTTPAAFVIPGGIVGGAATAVAGGFIQGTEDVVQVVLAIRTHQATGKSGIDPLKALIDAVLNSLCGWRPIAEAPGVLTLQRGALVSMTAGLVVYQIDLSLQTQLRISR